MHTFQIIILCRLIINEISMLLYDIINQRVIHYTLGLVTIRCTHFANIIFSEEDISGSKVSVDEALVTEVVHTTSNIPSKSQQHLRDMLSNRLTFPRG